MATDAPVGQDTLTTQEADEQLAARRVRTVSSEAPLLSLLMPLASLKFTVVLFVLATILVLAGTLAQESQDVWEVVKDYFRTPITWIPFQIFFPPAFTGNPRWNVPGGIYFPGGFTIGFLMAINLLAAHALRFKVQAKGARLLAGLAVIALGVVLTWMVVLMGSGKETIEYAEPQQWALLWTAMKWTLVLLWGIGAYAAWQFDNSRKIERWLIIGFEVILGALLIFIFTMGERAALGDSSLRILWQLIEGGVAGLILLAGCVLVFRKRAGIVLLHGGIALVMANELVVYFLHNENQMQISEGQTVDYAYDIRKVELAVTDASQEKTDKMTVVPQWMLEEQADIRDEQLPFDVEVVKYLQNSSLQKAKPGEKNPANKGFGVDALAVPRKAGTGTDAGGKVDMSAAYVNVLKRGTQESLGTYLVGIGIPEQQIEVDGKSYDLSLRFQRHYKPYSVTLEDVSADTYLGTNTPKNYSSDVRLVDKTRNVDTDVHIWMNNPLRYAGETFYQTSYDPGSGGREVTVLSIVSNTGWMIPYVACMLVGIGMLAQFSITLLRFLHRRLDAPVVPAAKSGRRNAIPVATTAVARYFPFAITALAAIMVLAAARPRPIATTEMKLDEFARLPVVHEGRVKPIDSVARNTLRYLSGKQSFKDENGKTQPAIKWFLDTIAQTPDVARKHKVLRIVSLDVQELLGLPRRPGFRYSIDEFSGKIAELDRQVQEAAALEPNKLTGYQKKLLELAKQLRAIQQFEIAFDPPQIRQDHAKEDLTAAVQKIDALSRMPLVLMVPPGGDQKSWDNFSSAWFNGLKDRVQGKEPNPAMTAMTKLIVAYGKGDVEGFNSELAQYQAWLAKTQPGDYNETKVNYEEFFNTFEPFYWALVLYVLAFLLVVFSWLGWSVPLNRGAFWVIVLALAIHTFALVSRIYISGRPPVTNLYSSAVFIGWAGVVFGIAIELIYRIGIGNVISAVIGFTTLLIANFLAGLSDGDTLGVLQAVLDTQFWLATHVVCEVLGYSATFVAGLLGVIYILWMFARPALTTTVGKDLSRMIYGTVCFAMFFSFVGTVLGGLWADDSWGRFWGWDPKENGALMIVLWNALVLHARWGGLVKQRGLAALAVGGNIITGWSWFGVNELGVGLHSYGFTEGVLLALGIFIITQLAIIAIATGQWLREPSSRTPSVGRG